MNDPFLLVRYRCATWRWRDVLKILQPDDAGGGDEETGVLMDVRLQKTHSSQIMPC